MTFTVKFCQVKHSEKGVSCCDHDHDNCRHGFQKPFFAITGMWGKCGRAVQFPCLIHSLLCVPLLIMMTMMTMMMTMIIVIMRKVTTMIGTCGVCSTAGPWQTPSMYLEGKVANALCKFSYPIIIVSLHIFIMILYYHFCIIFLSYHILNIFFIILYYVRCSLMPVCEWKVPTPWKDKCMGKEESAKKRKEEV